MNYLYLTKSGLPVNGPDMVRRSCRYWALLLVPAMTGCISVEAPSEPIVINLNIKIEQEVVYRLNDEARELIEQESEIF